MFDNRGLAGWVALWLETPKYPYLPILLNNEYVHSAFSRKKHQSISVTVDSGLTQRYTYRVLQTIQMKLILLCVWSRAELAVLGSTKTALKFKYEI